MSSDTTKENASGVDSSVTEGKHDMGNSDDQESPSYKGNGDGYPVRVEKSGCVQVGKSPEIRTGKLYNSRYFIIKSLNHHNIQISVENGIWATQVMNEPILEEAFHNSGRVILIFSVNGSGFFQGYAQMMSTVGWRRDNVWSQGSGKSNPWGCSFKVKWLRLNDLPFQHTLDLKNPWNEYKPVKISRDCQELPEDIGEALCALIDGELGANDLGRSDEARLKGPGIEPPCSLGGMDYNIPSLQMPWTGATPPSPFFLYQNNVEAIRFYSGQQGSTAVLPENQPPFSATSKVMRAKRPRANGNISNLQVQCDTPSRSDAWGLSAESPLASTLTEDDFLDMTYEEYLEAHGRSIKQLNLPQAGPPSTVREPSRSKTQDNDSDSSFVSGNSRSRKRSHDS